MHPGQRAKLGFLLHDISPSELSLNILYRGMQWCNEIDTVVFFEQITKPCINSVVSKMHIFEAYGFDGPLIATDLNTCTKLLRFPTPRPKIFFLNDLEWIRTTNKQYESLAQVYRNPQLHLFCRSEDHKALVENCWNLKVAQIVERYNFYTPELFSFYTKLSKPIYSNRTKSSTNINIKSLNI